MGAVLSVELISGSRLLLGAGQRLFHELEQIAAHVAMGLGGKLDRNPPSHERIG